MDSPQNNLIDHFLVQIQASANKQRSVFWSKKHLLSTTKTTLGLLPSLVMWYVLLVQGLAVFLQFNTGSMLWQSHPIPLILTGLVLLTTILLIARVSTRAKNQNKITLFAMTLFGSFFLVVILPKGWGWIGVLFLGLSTLFYWLTPWSKIKQTFLPMSTHSGATMAVMLQISESVSRLPYSNMRMATLRLLKDFLQKINDQTHPHQTAVLGQFAQDFSEHIKPLLAALSYRAKSLNNDTPELMTFMELYPPFPAHQRTDFNLPATYINVLLQNDNNLHPLKAETKMLWLKSALIVADLSPKTSHTSLCDIELMLINALLSQTIKNQREIKDLLIRFMQRLHCSDCKLNVFQQNSWIQILELIRDLPEVDEDIRRKWCGYDYQWQEHRNSFAEGSFAYSAEREGNLKILAQAIWTKIDGSDTGPSLIGIKSDLWKVGCIDDEEDHLTESEIQQNFEEDLQSTNTQTSSLLFLERLLNLGRYVLYEFVKTVPDNHLAEFLTLLNEADRKRYYQVVQDQFDMNIELHFETLVNKIQPQAVNEAPLFELLLRYLRAGDRLSKLIIQQINEYDDTSYTQDHEHYEYDVESKLNQATMRRVDHIEDLFSEILKELKNDIDTANLDLQDFIDHLGYKFGALVFSINACFNNDIFEWFLHSAQNQTSIIETEAIKSHYPIRIMMETIHFQYSMLKGDKTGSFNALNQLFILHSVRYPLHKEATEACLVSCIEMLSQTEQPSKNIQAFFNALASLPKDYNHLTPEKQNDLQKIIKLAIAKYNLIEHPKLTNNQKNLLSRFMVSIEDI